MVKLSIARFAAALAALMLSSAVRAQTPAKISVVQGNGQLVCDSCQYTALPLFDPLVVQVTDVNNNPVPNAAVTWTVIGSSYGVLGSMSSTTTTTGSSTSSSAVICNFYNSTLPEKSGQSCNVFSEGASATSSTGYIANTVTASIANGQSVTFYLTQGPFDLTGGSSISASVTMDSVQLGTTISGPVNSVYPTAIKVMVQTVAGSVVPNISVRLVAQSGQLAGASISCQTGTGADPGSVFTSASGIAICPPVFGPTPGTTPTNFDILVGGVPALLNPNSVNGNNNGVGNPAGYSQFATIRATATAVNPASVRVFSGNNQSANAGTLVANPLVVQVLDSNGNSLSGVSVNWSVTQPNGTAAAVSPTAGPTDSNGKASTNVTLAASASGNVQVTATVGSLSQSFSITVTMPAPPLSSLTKVPGGDGQSAPEGMAFSTPLAVMATLTGGASASGVPVQFAITGGTGTLSASGGSPTQSVVVPTGSNGQASVTATAGSSPGTLTVVASVSGFTQTFSLTILPPPPPISSSSFLNGAGFFATSGSQQTALSPCGVATLVVGSPLAPSAFPVVPNMYTTPLQQPGNISVSFQLAGATATTMAPILNVATASTSQQLITFQVPCEIQANSWTVNVSINGTSIAVPGVTVRPGAPGIFETLGSDGARRAIAVRPDGSIVSLSNPARRGEIIRFYITGAGPVLPALASASLPTPGVPSTPTDPNQVVVGLNNAGVGGVMVQAATELIGVYEVTFQVPNDPSLVGTNNVLAVGVTALGNPTQYQQPGGSKLPIQ